MGILYLCSIGPVQDFIATARKSRDLWYGSWLLSELSKAIAKHLAVNFGFDNLIFPHPEQITDLEPNTPFNSPNKITAVLNEINEDIAKNIHQAMFKRFEELRKEAFSKINGPYKNQLAEDQVRDLPEFYWVAVPYPEDYPAAREKAELYLAARKNTRDFSQVLGDHSPKSSLDGMRESVILESAYPDKKDNNQERVRKIRELYHNYHAQQAERLSGVDLMKRLGRGKDEPNFPSTSDLAASPLFASLPDQSKAASIINEIKELLINSYQVDKNDIAENAALVFESRLFEYLPDRGDQEIAREQLTEILEKYFGKSKPNPYYALFIADGDNMGKFIDTNKNIETHRNLSKTLSTFAQNVPEIIASFGGTCIYAGGEDILAYLPLHKALACARELEDTYKKAMGAFSFAENGMTVTPTLSGGIIIAHHLEPLSEVLALARSAERNAKDIDGKNGLAIVLDKRSGAERIVKAKWTTLIDRFEKLVYFQRKGWISAGAAYELQELHQKLDCTTFPETALAEEALRIIRRKRQSGGQLKMPDDVRQQFQTWLTTGNISVGDLALEMIIAKEFASAENLANKAFKEVQQ